MSFGSNFSASVVPVLLFPPM